MRVQVSVEEDVAEDALVEAEDGAGVLPATSARWVEEVGVDMVVVEVVVVWAVVMVVPLLVRMAVRIHSKQSLPSAHIRIGGYGGPPSYSGGGGYGGGYGGGGGYGNPSGQSSWW